MGKVLEKPDDTLYERDFYAWLQNQAAKLRVRSHNDIDWDNLAEEIESAGKSEKKEIRRRLGILIQDLLKWQHQPGRRRESWRLTIGEQRIAIPDSLADSPSLWSYPQDVFAKTYADGRRWALAETGMAPSAIPTEPGFNVAQAPDPSFWPGEPSEVGLIMRD